MSISVNLALFSELESWRKKLGAGTWDEFFKTAIEIITRFKEIEELIGYFPDIEEIRERRWKQIENGGLGFDVDSQFILEVKEWFDELRGAVQGKCCLTCEHLKFGFPSDRVDACDYVCEIDGTAIFLLCTHGLTDEEVQEKLRKKGRNCPLWKKSKEA